MKLKITVDVFSGRENPVIELDHRASLRALDRLQPDEELSARERKVPEGMLRYRGLVIEQIGRGTTRLPSFASSMASCSARTWLIAQQTKASKPTSANVVRMRQSPRRFSDEVLPQFCGFMIVMHGHIKIS